MEKNWIQWIKMIISTAKQSVLVNGSPTREFLMERGLPQGDPISPSLFIIVTQVLHVLIEKAKEIGLIKGIRIGSILNFTHLQFADDTVLFLEDAWSSIKGIKIVLTIFEILSGLKVNYQKSFLYTHNDLVQCWAEWLQCKI